MPSNPNLDKDNLETRSIRSANFGGLNSASSPLNMPYTDAQYLLNVDVSDNGNLVKRRGTDVVYSNPGSSQLFGTSVRSSLGYQFLLAKLGTALALFAIAEPVDGASTQTVIKRQYSNVFPASSAGVKPYWVVSTETDTRVICLHARVAPIQLVLHEWTTTISGTTTTIVIPNATRFQSATTSNPALVYRNGAALTVTTHVYNSTTQELTITTPTLSAGNRIDVIVPVWNWWAEALLWYGDRFYDVVSRFNVTTSDQNVAVPPAIRSDMSGLAGVPTSYPLAVYGSSRLNSQYTSSSQPQLATEFGFGDGSVYVYNAERIVNRAPLFATFGSTRTPLPQPAESVHFVRFRELRFNGDRGILNANLSVVVDNIERAVQHINAEAPGVQQYVTFGKDGNFIDTAGAAATYAYFASFNCSFPMGVPPLSVVKLINKERKWVGTSATQSTETYLNGSLWEAYGFGLYADYDTGLFPTCGAVFQGRLCLAGFQKRPNVILFSNSGDSVEAGALYNFYQITDDLDELATNPFDAPIASNTAGDAVQGVVEWQSSLFALTKRACYRITGGDTIITESNRGIQFVSAQGLVNPHAICRTDAAVYYLSDVGVLNLIPRIETGEYVPDEKSTKIRPVFEGRNHDASWLAYDLVQRKLYCALSLPREVGTASDLFVYNTFRDAWSNYATVGGFMTTGGISFNANGVSFLLFYGGTNTALLATESDFYLDYHSFVTTTPAATINTGAVNLTANVLGKIADTDLTTKPQNVPQFDNAYGIEVPKSVMSLEINDIRDIQVTGLSYGTDWVKDRGRIVLYSAPFPITPPAVSFSPSYWLSFVGQQEFPSGVGANYAVWAYTPSTNVRVDYNPSVDATLGTNLVFTTSQPLAEYHLGYIYTAAYISPTFNFGTILNQKKMRNLAITFDNRPFHDAINLKDFRNKVSVNVALLLDESPNGGTTYDLYDYNNLGWDYSFFDIGTSPQQAPDQSTANVPLYGIGYDLRFCIWSQDSGAWSLSGYQIGADNLTGKSRSRYA